ncbi:unnamed protein product [Oreochromis niloticus]|nr:unnamed protein product [Mustela putorius furo]
MEIILQEIQEFRKENSTQLEDIKVEIHKTNRRIDEVENRIEAAETRVQTLEQVLKYVLKTQAQHNEKLRDQVGRARRDNLRIYNVPENEEGDSMINFVEKLIRENLDIPLGTELHIERAHRVLTSKPTTSERPRSIVIKFHHYKTKEDILRKAWIKDIMIKNRRIYFDHDYPTAILNKRKEYNEVKRVLKEKKIHFQTPYPARLRVFYEEGTRLYHSAEEATKDLKDRGFPVRVTPPQWIIWNS